jgi:nitrogen regulatory protein P-II 1
MKKIEVRIHVHKIADVSEALKTAGFGGPSVSGINGYTDLTDREKKATGYLKDETFSAKATIEIVVADEDVEKAILIIRESGRPKKIGDDKKLPHPLYDAIHIYSVK